jgi:hypothetical protein
LSDTARRVAGALSSFARSPPVRHRSRPGAAGGSVPL